MADSNASSIPTPATPDVCTFKILVDGNEISGEFQVLSIAVTRELNRIPSATLQFLDGEASQATFKISNTADFIPGKKVEIKLGYKSQEDTVFKGIVIKHSIKIRKNGSVLLVDCRDESVKMTSGAKSKYYANKKDKDIMEEVIDGYGLQKKVEATTPSLKEVVQYEATDWDFLICRAEANGMVVMVEDGKINVAKPNTSQLSAVNVSFGATILEFDAEIDARWQSKGIKATSWNAADQQVIDAQATEPSTTNNGNLTHSDLSKVIGGDPHEIRHGGKMTQPELQVWADGILLKERLAKVRGRAKFQGFAGVLPGKIIEISGVGDRFEGKLYISGVRHTLEKGNWETDVQFGLSPELFAETHNLRPLPAAGLLPAVSGLQIGIVTKLESDPEGEDRIQVRLPLVDPQNDGVWARVATLDAGDQRGTYFRPEIDDEVIVGFLHDDPRYPVILGMCHSSKKPAPEPAKDTNHHKGYVSREKMKFTFDDDKKVIVLETPGGNKMTLSEDAKGIQMEDQNGNKIILDDSGIKIESSKDLTIKAAKDIKIEGANITLKAKSAFKAEGSASAEVSGASTTVKGSASTTIKGGVVQIN
jgi:Rhs element Vgr protein